MAAFNRARLTSTQGTQLNPVRAQPMHSLSCSSSRCLSVRATAQIQQNSDGQRSTPLADASSKLVSGLTAGIIALIVTGAPLSAEAVGGPRRPPPITEEAGRCEVSALDKFADTRAMFSQEASGGNMTEANVDIRGCDFSGLDLSGKVFSGVMMQGANMEGAKVVGSQFARADARSANLQRVDFTDTNCYSTKFDGADLREANFENSVLTGSTFGRDGREGPWANLAGAHFEGALVSSSDIQRICENPTLELTTKKYELGCRATK